MSFYINNYRFMKFSQKNRQEKLYELTLKFLLSVLRDNLFFYGREKEIRLGVFTDFFSKLSIFYKSL